MSPGEPIHPFGDGFAARLFGRAFGDASPQSPGVPTRIVGTARALGFDEVVLMQAGFTHELALPARIEARAPHLSRTIGPADGVLLDRPGRAAWVASADCATGLLRAPDGRVAVLHLGLDCLWRERGATLLDNAIEHLGGPSSLRFWVGFAIGPCCLGYSHDREDHLQRARHLVARYGPDPIGGEVARGPRRGQIAYDLISLALTAAAAAGVPDLACDRTCTSCTGAGCGDGPGDWYSNVRDGRGSRGRNLMLAGEGPSLHNE